MLTLLLSISSPQAPGLDEFLESMRLPAKGHYLIERQSEYRPPSPEDLARALQTSREHQAEWHDRASAEDPIWVRERPHLFEPEWVPLLLVRAENQFEGARTTEFVEWQRESFHWTTEDIAHFASGKEKTIPITRHRVQLGDELITWFDSPQGPSQVNRIYAGGKGRFLDYGSQEFAERCAEARSLGQLSRGQGGFRVEEGDLVFEVDLRSPITIEAFSRVEGATAPDLPVGLHQMPGTVTGRVTRSARGTTLTVEWTCFSGALVCSDLLRWEEVGEFPTEMRRELRVPGAEQPYSVTRCTARLVPGSLPMRWNPLPGQPVIDSRFGRTRRYTVEADGTLPDDGALAERAEREHLLEQQPAFDEYEFLDSGRDQGPPGLVLRWDTIDLGRQPMQSVHPISFALTNRGTEPIELGDAQADCTCLDLRNPAGTLAPGSTILMTARQRILGVGRLESLIRIPAGTDSEIELAVRATGIEAPVVIPDPIHAGRVVAGTTLPFEVTVSAAECVEDGDRPLASAEGFTVEQSWELRDDLWFGRLALAPEPAPVLGAREVILEVRGAACPSDAGKTLVFFETVPLAAHEDWPTCRVVVRRGAAAPLRLRFPGTKLLSVNSETPNLSAEIESADDGDELLLSAIGSSDTRSPIQSATLDLATSRGPVRIKAIVPPSRPRLGVPMIFTDDG